MDTGNKLPAAQQEESCQNEPVPDERGQVKGTGGVLVKRGLTVAFYIGAGLLFVGACLLTAILVLSLVGVPEPPRLRFDESPLPIATSVAVGVACITGGLGVALICGSLGVSKWRGERAPSQA